MREKEGHGVKDWSSVLASAIGGSPSRVRMKREAHHPDGNGQHNCLFAGWALANSTDP